MKPRTRKQDHRTERTRAILKKAFVDLLLARGYENVTIDEIAACANVGRSTFYMYFHGKKDILRQSMTRPSSFLAILVGHDVTPNFLHPILLHFRDQRRLNRVFFQTPLRPMWVSCLAEMIEPRLAKLVRITDGRPLIPLNTVATEIAEAQIGLVVHWLTVRPNTKPEAIARALIESTRALALTLLRPRAGAALIIPGERLQVVHAQG